MIDSEEELDTCSKVEKSKTPSMGRDTVSVTPWTEAKTDNCQTARDFLKTRTSPKQETDFTAGDMNPVEETVATNGHHNAVLARNAIQENGYGSPHDKQGSAIIRHCQYEHNIHRERPKNFETPVAVDSLPTGDGGRIESDARHCETWKMKDPSPGGAQDCNKTGNSHSEVTKIVPLKPQRSKKSLNKENTGVVNPQTQSGSDRGSFGATGDVQMTKSKDGSCEAGRRVDDNAVLLSDTDVVKENTGATKYHGEAGMSYQQQAVLHQQIKNELLGQEVRGTTGQSPWKRGGHEDHFQNNSEFKDNLLSSCKFPTAPPRSLPLKTQWSRDRQSNVDSSHIHYRAPSQETAKRKQAVKPSAPPS